MIRAVFLAAALFAAAPAFAQTAPAPAAKPAMPATPAAMTHDAMPLDINTATVEQLAGVKGLTKPFAEAIVKGRPYKSADELAKNKIVPESVFAMVKDLLTVGRK
jgi:DNA uptake protein ComE-like DNA-binding protein